MHLDLAVFHAVNGLCGNWLLDRIAAYEENNFFFKGAVFLTLYWWFWFAPEQDRRLRNRQIIIAAIIGAVVALALNRALAVALPFRVRPMYAAGIGYHAPSFAFAVNLEKWSAFPSDSATYWFALSCGLFRLNRPQLDLHGRRIVAEETSVEVSALEPCRDASVDLRLV